MNGAAGHPSRRHGYRERASTGESRDISLATPRSLSPASQHDEQDNDSRIHVPQPIASTPSPGTVPNSAVNDQTNSGNVSYISEAKVPVLQPAPIKPDKPQVLKLSQAQMYELTTSPESVPIRKEDSLPVNDPCISSGATSQYQTPRGSRRPTITQLELNGTLPNTTAAIASSEAHRPRPILGTRAASSPVITRRNTVQGQRPPTSGTDRKPILNIKTKESDYATGSSAPATSDFLPRQKTSQTSTSAANAALPLPPLSLPTYLHLELSSDRPSPLFIHRNPAYDIPYESSSVKFERLLNFLLVPHQLERVLLFGTLACLDAWLYNFTILPLRFIKAAGVLGNWWLQSFARELRDLAYFVYTGLGRFIARRRVNESSKPSPKPLQHTVSGQKQQHTTWYPEEQLRSPPNRVGSTRNGMRHRRTRSVPSALLPNHKHDILHGLLIVLSCWILVHFDASRMYHSIRGQAAIKLYVIYNVLEVGDRLFSALGQDVLECLFSKETLERKPNGRSKVIRPFWIFTLALVYNVIHATMLFYQVVTLNVAVNSYSNALLTLLMSNQFVEIRGTVFKKFEKENLFQMVCADVVERFQLWLMLLIIALRNIAEAGGLSLGRPLGSLASSAATSGANSTDSPLTVALLPQAFTLIPKFTGQVLGPFLIVLGSEMLVDWLKHAYINKFNAVKPTIYARFLDVLAKDYYSHAFADQNLTKRIGLPVLPLSCLFMRAAVQTYHMFLAAHVPLPLPSSVSTATSIAVESVRESSAATTAALARVDVIIRRALGRSSFGGGVSHTSWMWNADDMIALTTMILFFSILYLFLLAFKLVLGMTLLQFARSRYRGMMEREQEKYDVDSRRIGPWGAIEMRDDTKKAVNAEDTSVGVSKREQGRGTKTKKDVPLDAVQRYMMVAKRIW